MTDIDWLNDLMASVDARNTAGFMRFLDRDCIFRFGNLPAAVGYEAVETFVGGFFASIRSLRHEIVDSWPVPDGVVCHGLVSYTRHDRSVLTVPFAIVFKMTGNKIGEYLIFADASSLYAE